MVRVKQVAHRFPAWMGPAPRVMPFGFDWRTGARLEARTGRRVVMFRPKRVITKKTLRATVSKRIIRFVLEQLVGRGYINLSKVAVKMLQAEGERHVALFLRSAGIVMSSQKNKTLLPRHAHLVTRLMSMNEVCEHPDLSDE